ATPALGLGDCGSHLLHGQAVGVQHRRGSGLGHRHDRRQHVRRPNLDICGLLRLSDRLVDDPARGLGESFEHQRLPCFLCTACLVTPSSSAISCQDQPCTLALRTWTASRRSSSLRNVATARSPTRGSSLPAAVAKSVASVMVSTYVDSTTMSTSVDTCG